MMIFACMLSSYSNQSKTQNNKKKKNTNKLIMDLLEMASNVGKVGVGLLV